MLENSTELPHNLSGMPEDEGKFQQPDELEVVSSSTWIKETKYQDMFEHSPNGMYRSSPEGQFLQVNPALAQIYGYKSPDELIESINNIATQLYIDEYYRSYLLKRLKEEQQLCGVEVQVQRKDESVVWILESARVVQDQDGHVLYYEGTVEDITERKYTEGLLRQQLDKERLLSSITLKIHQSIDLNEILQTTVDEVREVLETDRVLVFRFNEEGDGYVPVESIRSERLSVIHLDLHDPCFDATYQELFVGGRVSAISDLRESHSPNCYIEFLEQLSVIANLVVPIVKGDRLIGLLIAHHCTAPRQWQPWEMYLLQQLAAQVAIAVHQSELYQQLQIELAERQRIERDLRNSEAMIRALYAITSSQELTFEDCLYKILELGREQFTLETGMLAHIQGDCYEVIMAQHPNNITTKGTFFSTQQTYCSETIAASHPLTITNAGNTDWNQHPCYQAFHIETYLGGPVMVNGQVYGSLCFYSQMACRDEFSSVDQELVGLMAQWIGRELERTMAAQELAKARDHALEVTQIKSEFLATMSHEIRTPMNAVIGMTELLLDTQLNSEQQRFAQTICRSSESLLAIINDTLDVSKIEAGKLELEYRPFNLRLCVEDVCDLLAGFAQQKEIELLHYINSDVPLMIMGDIARLRQVLVNLVNNAVKFTPQGEVTVSVWSSPSSPSSSSPLSSPAPSLSSFPSCPLMSSTSSRVACSTHTLEIIIRDTGIGIPKAKMHRLFQPFSQVDTSTTRKYGGTGLGLVICQRLIQMMGGTITVQSQEGEGTAFHIVMPIEAIESNANESKLMFQKCGEYPLTLTTMETNTVDVESANKKYQSDLSLLLTAEQDISNYPLQDKQVLIVDDNITSRDFLRRQMTEWNMVVHTCASGKDALNFVENYLLPDLVLLDGNMPNMSSMTIAQKIQQLSAPKLMPIIMLQPLGQSSAQEESTTQFGIISILNKPIKKSHLFDAVINRVERKFTSVHSLYKVNHYCESNHPKDNVKFDHALGITHPLKILVAEDNQINQKLAQHLLQRLGYEIDIVSDGLAVIETIKIIEDINSQPYDLIFMDLHMPKMDGITATQKIREMEFYQRPQIVAVTASATEQDRHQCLAAGMDAYISKPIRIEQLTQVLRTSYEAIQLTKSTTHQTLTHSNNPKQNSNELGKVSNPHNMYPPSIHQVRNCCESGEIFHPSQYSYHLHSSSLDSSIIQQSLEMVNYDYKFIHELMHVFLAEAQAGLVQLQEAIAPLNLYVFQQITHSLKSSSASIGATHFSTLCKTLENQAKTALQEPEFNSSSPDSQLFQLQYNQLCQEYERVQADITHYCHLNQKLKM